MPTETLLDAKPVFTRTQVHTLRILTAIGVAVLLPAAILLPAIVPVLGYAGLATNIWSVVAILTFSMWLAAGVVVVARNPGYLRMFAPLDAARIQRLAELADTNQAIARYLRSVRAQRDLCGLDFYRCNAYARRLLRDAAQQAL